MKSRFHFSARALASLSSAIVACLAPAARAADGTWTGVTSGLNWSDTAAWAAGVVADGPGFSADFSTLDLPAGTFSVVLDTARTIGGMKFGDTDTATLGAWNISGANTLTLGGTAPTIDTGVNANVLVPVAGTSFTKQGSGTLLLTGTNTIAGTVSLNAGQISVRNGAALGAATNGLAMANGTTFRIEGTNGTSGSGVFVGSPITVATGASVTLTSGFASNGYSGLVSGDAASVFNIGAVGATTQVSLNLGGNTQQFGAFLGRVEIYDGTSLRFSATSGVSNGGASAIWDTNTSGAITTRNAATVHLGVLTGSGKITMGTSGSSNGWATYNIGNAGISSTFGGEIADGDAATGKRVAITKVGTGSLTLTHPTLLTYTGTTTVSAGSLIINGAKSGTGVNNVNSGGTLAGTGSVAGLTTVKSGGVIAPGDGGIGNLTLSSLTLESGSSLALGFGSGNDTITVASGGALAMTSGVSVDVGGFGTDGTFLIIPASGATISGNAASAMTAVNTNTSKVYSFASDASGVKLTIASSDPTNYWKPDSGGTWDVAGNWTKNTVPNASGAVARFGPGPEGLGGFFSVVDIPVTMDAARTVGELILDDGGSNFTISEGATGGALLFDNGASQSSLLVTNAYTAHSISAPVGLGTQGLVVDVAAAKALDVSGVVSGSSLGKSGLGDLSLSGTNTYTGGTTLSAGNVVVTDDANLGATGGALTFAGGTLRLDADMAGFTRASQLSAGFSASFDTNGHAVEYGGAITALSGATGGLTKSGTGTLKLTASQNYPGATTVNAGVLEIPAGTTVQSASSAINAGSSKILVSGGDFTTTGATNIAGASVGLEQTAGSSHTAGVNGNTTNASSNIFINLTGGTFDAGYVTMGRSAGIITIPTAGSTTAGLYVNGATATISGNLTLGTGTLTNSSVSTRIDAGSLAVGGTVLLQINNPGRWVVLDVNGGTFTSTEATTGVQLGSGQTGNTAFLVRQGTATVQRIYLTQPAASTSTSRVSLSGGALYVGAGGIVGNNNAGAGILDVTLGDGTLGASAAWNSSVAATLAGSTIIKAADAADAPFDITLGGVLGGTGGFTKAGTGTLTLSAANTYTGAVSVNAGTLSVTGDDSAATGAITVASGATLAGAGNLGGNVTIQSGGHHALAVAATPAAQVGRAISGTLTLDSGNVLDLSAAATPADGTYILATAAGGITGTPGTVNLPVGVSGTVSVSGNNLQLVIGTSGYASWAGTAALTAANDGPTMDPDNDGISNQLEFVLGGNPLASDTSILPTLNGTGADFVFTFKRNDESEAEVALTFQYGTDLTSWTDVAIGATGGGAVTLTENGTGADDITITIPKGANTRLFGRLKSVK